MIFLVGLTQHEVDVVLTDMPIISQCVLNQGISIVTTAFRESLIALIQVHTVALCPCRNPRKVLRMRLTVREVQIVMQAVVLVVKAQYLEQINVSRAIPHETVYQSVALQEVIHKQRIGSRDVTMNVIIVYSIPVCIVFIAICQTHLVVKHPR